MFGESQSRVIVTASPNDADRLQQLFDDGGIACARIGVVKGEQLRINRLLKLSLADMFDAFYPAMHRFMDKVER